jgi:uncharacterized protein (DUF1800 family)
LKWAGHAYRRLAFGARRDELRQAVAQGHSATLDRLLSGGPGQEEFDELVDDTTKGLSHDAEESTLHEYQAVWLYRMLHSPHPLRERLTLFWHNHFATSIAKVRQPALMQQQNALIRKHALGKFRSLVVEMSRDPAMLIWLDSNSNVKGQPNENFARELMELFTLGVGHYTENDVRQAARAFTGWHTAGGKFIFNEAQHDGGRKTVVGRTGNWDGTGVLRILLAQKAAARFLVRKLYRHFINEHDKPPDHLLEPLAEEFRNSDYDIAGVLRTMARSRHFFSDHAYRQRVKSPVEFALGLVHSLEGQVAPTALAAGLDGLGQNLFSPPNVKGWVGGKAWLNSATVLARHNLAWAVVGGEDATFNEHIDVAALVRKHAGKGNAGQLGFLLDLFLQGDVEPSARHKLVDYLKATNPKGVELDKRLRETAHTILLMPEYQLA